MDKILGMSSLVLLHSDFYKCNGYYEGRHCVKSVQMRSFFWSLFSEYGEILHISPYSVRMRKNGPEKTPYLDTFQAERGWIIIQVTSNRITNMTKFLHLCLLYTKKSQTDIRAAIREVQMMKKLSLYA